MVLEEKKPQYHRGFSGLNSHTFNFTCTCAEVEKIFENLSNFGRFYPHPTAWWVQETWNLQFKFPFSQLCFTPNLERIGQVSFQGKIVNVRQTTTGWETIARLTRYLQIDSNMVFLLGPLAISCLAFIFKNKNARFSHENPKRVWNLDLFKNARLENARAKERDFYLAVALSLPRPRILAFSSLAFFSRHARLENPRWFIGTLLIMKINKKCCKSCTHNFPYSLEDLQELSSIQKTGYVASYL